MKIYQFIFSISVMLLFGSCNNFLEVKPDVKMVIPKSLTDAELLLNDYNTMNAGYPIFGEWSADEYYITPETFDGKLNFDQRSAYTWQDANYDETTQWQRPYKTIFNANQVLEIINKLGVEGKSEKAINLSGIAHFYRAFAFHQLVEVFAPVYKQETASAEMGIPIRLDPGIDAASTRASLQQSYDQIIEDYNIAVRKLPISESIKGRPFRASAYAGLARTYLVMENFQQAYKYADSCLQLQAELMDFSKLNQTETLPISRFNVEVLFAAISVTSGPMHLNNGLVDSILYKSYSPYDLRKYIFFRKNTYPLDSYSYKGSYDKSMANLFVGLTTSEIYLIKAEAACRIGQIEEAIQLLNALLENRIDKSQFVAVTENNQDALLHLILHERQKELLFRGRRWSDLKRLNLDPRFQKTLKRVVNNIEFLLEPNSRKYAFRLPQSVVLVGKIPQNIR